MLNETLKALRKLKGYSQEEVAGRLNVVRQTVSKWEKGLSVPDADMLVMIAELFEVSVPTLLGAPPEPADSSAGQSAAPLPDMSEIAEQLSRINEQLVVKNRRAKRVWKIAGTVVLAWVLLKLAITVFSVAAFSAYRFEDSTFETSVYEESTELENQAETQRLP